MIDLKKHRSKTVVAHPRQWEKVIEPLLRYKPDANKLGYPLQFILQLEKLVAGHHSLQLNIPTTLSGIKDNCLRTVFKADEEIGEVVFTPSMVKSSFDYEIEKEMQERLSKLCEKDNVFRQYVQELKNANLLQQILPLVIIKKQMIDLFKKVQRRSTFYSRDDYKKMPNIDMNHVAQSYVYSAYKTTSMIRFFYFPNKHNSVAYKIDNNDRLVQRRTSKKHWRINESNQNSFTYLKIMFANKSFFKQTVNLVHYLQKHMNIQIEKIVTDWTLDPNNRYYLLDVREVLSTQRPQPLSLINDLNDFMAYISCSVCQQKFHAEQISKFMTNKMVWQFFEHLKKRQIILTFKPLYRYSSDALKVCDVCYELIISQIKLIEMQKVMTVVTHSVTNQPKRGLSIKNLLPANDISQKMMYQWRLFLYLQDIRDLQLDESRLPGTYYVMLRIHNTITSFKIGQIKNKLCSIKGIKVHYLFSETQKIDKFLTKTQVTIRITTQNNWNTLIAQGNTNSLYEQSQKHSIRKFKQILVFNSRSEYSVVGLHLGIKLEGKYNIENFNLKQYLDAYMVNEEYSNSYAFPAEWMETIDPSYCMKGADEDCGDFGADQFEAIMHLPHTKKKKSMLPKLKGDSKRLTL